MIAAARQHGCASSMTYALPFSPLEQVRPQANHSLVGGGITPALGGAGQSLTRAFFRAQRQGWVSFYIADELACALGYHPAELWGELWAG